MGSTGAQPTGIQNALILSIGFSLEHPAACPIQSLSSFKNPLVPDTYVGLSGLELNHLCPPFSCLAFYQCRVRALVEISEGIWYVLRDLYVDWLAKWCPFTCHTRRRDELQQLHELEYHRHIHLPINQIQSNCTLNINPTRRFPSLSYPQIKDEDFSFPNRRRVRANRYRSV